MPSATRVLCVDDNQDVVEAIRILVARTDRYAWAGSLATADGLTEFAPARQAAIVLLDIDMPGRDPFAAVRELAAHCPEIRVIILSGHVRKDLVNRAVASGAWGYVAKSDGEAAILRAVEQVVAEEFAMSPEVRSGYSL